MHTQNVAAAAPPSSMHQHLGGGGQARQQQQQGRASTAWHSTASGQWFDTHTTCRSSSFPSQCPPPLPCLNATAGPIVKADDSHFHRKHRPPLPHHTLNCSWALLPVHQPQAEPPLSRVTSTQPPLSRVQNKLTPVSTAHTCPPPLTCSRALLPVHEPHDRTADTIAFPQATCPPPPSHLQLGSAACP
jgi:hypothetical protein